MASQETLLSEIARKLRKLDCICEGVNLTGNLVVKNYQPLDCSGLPVGSPIDVMPTISIAKQDVSVCNTTALATAINGLYNVPNMIIVASGGTTDTISTHIDVTKLHSVSVTIIGTTGTVDMTGDLGGGIQTATALPVGFSINFDASTVFGSGDISFTTTGDATVIISCISTL
ncbi:MAG: hypothetical protein WCK31_05090 [bacterium]